MDVNRMPKKEPDKYLSKKERERFDAMAEAMTVKDAAAKLDMTDGSLYNWLYKLRKRLVKERGHLNTCLAQMQRSSLLKEILSIKKPIEKADDTESEL